MTPKRWALLLVFLAVAATFLPSRRPLLAARTARPRARIGLVFDVGGRGDKSFNDAAYVGVTRAAEEFPDIEISYLEPVNTEDREAALRLFAARGFDLVIGVGFIFSSDIDAVAASYPNTHFAGIDYAPGPRGTPPNVAALAFREEEGAFLVGAVAGLMSKSHSVGFVGGMAGPLIRKFEFGYREGVKAACEKCEVHAAYAGASPDAFRDPAKGKALGNAQIALGADVLFHASGATGRGVFEAASDGRVMAIGVDSDQHDDMPSVVVTSLIKRGDVAVYNVVKEVVEKRFQPGMRLLGLRERGLDYVHDGPHAERIPLEVKQRVEQLRNELIEGKRHLGERQPK